MSMNETAPAGVPSDYYHETQVPAVWGFCMFVIFFGVLTLGLRFYARYTAGNSFWWDDWFALAVLPMMTLEAAVDIKTIDFGWGRHTIVPLNTNPLLLEDFYRYLFILTFSYSGGVAMFKCSALALYCRIFGVHRRFRLTCIGLGVLILTWTGIIWFVHIFRCDPIRGQWNHRGATCILNLEEIHSMISIPTVVFGAITLLLPVKLVWQLKLGLPQRISLLFAFLLGGLDIIISIIRYRVIVTIPEDDPMWKSLPTMYWSLAEPVAGLLCCCLPVYAPFLNALRRKLGLTTVGSSNGHSGQGNHSSSRSRSGSHGISKSRTRGGTFGNSQDTKSSTHVGSYPSFYRHESGSDTVELTELEKQDIDRPDKVYYVQDRRWR